MDIAVAPMPDITQPQTVQAVERRLEGQAQGGRAQGGAHLPAGKVAADYEEAAKGQPADDRITILGIPVEQITPATQAALGGLVAEIDHLRGVVKRLERSADREPAALASAVRTHLTAAGYVVNGIDMALAVRTAAAAIGTGESAVLALGRADHLLRAAPVA